ncbi:MULTISPECIES: sucrase ferredoxin [unclassified Streptomyces]|uniref:sucrase ferredoxin n=1 Tax=unclassified Streptomyces TaxID=2593676 RepID=UPI002E2B6A04|nr:MULTISPECIES: sucrase ferredoxin [unclassified Streptomyces]WUB85700.1 sucrase ferredoxin [Streptomyces sp. NBC_00566]
MSSSERFFCADAARLRGDPLAGTAPRGVVWVLIEYRGAWPSNGYDGIALDPEIKSHVWSAAHEMRARIFLIRRLARPRPEGPGRWAVLHYERSGASRQRWGTWSRDQDLVEIAEALHTPGHLDQPPVVLVCAHGQHDICCAVRGRPVARVLGERWPNLVWECTHVGGDRFAANVVVVPDGVYYGRLDPTSAVEVVEEHLAGRIHPEHLRGYTDLAPPQQVAVAALLERFGPAGRHDYTVTGTVRDGDDWRIRVELHAPRPTAFDIEVHARRTAPYQLTCRGPVPSPAVGYEVRSIRAA